MTGKTAQSFLIQQDGAHYVVTFAKSMTACASLWSRLEREFVCSPYQKLAFCRNWLDAQAEPKPQPCCLLVSDAAGTPLFFAPFIVEQHQGLRLAKFMGGATLNFAVPLFAKKLKLPDEALYNIFAQFAGETRIDLFHIDRIPQTWGEEYNPLLALPHTLCVHDACWHKLDADPAATLKTMRSPRHLKQLRHKLQKLEKSGKVSLAEARLPAERAEALSMFFDLKSEWAQRMNLHNAFADKSVQTFIRAMSLTEGALRIFTMRYDGSLRAIFLGLHHQKRFCGLASAYEADDIAAFSPGDLLLHHVISCACEEGYEVFDLGVGDAAYKKRWLHEEEPLHTAIFGFGWKGRALAQTLTLKHALERALKKLR
jgi:CelD/BcsL family acetyltransferase involved in cellulose biosynthesis